MPTTSSARPSRVADNHHTQEGRDEIRPGPPACVHFSTSTTSASGAFFFTDSMPALAFALVA